MDWRDYFFVRLDDDGFYYVAWIKSQRSIKDDLVFNTWQHAKEWARDNYRSVLDEEFEKEVLGGSK